MPLKLLGLEGLTKEEREKAMILKEIYEYLMEAIFKLEDSYDFLLKAYGSIKDAVEIGVFTKQEGDSYQKSIEEAWRIVRRQALQRLLDIQKDIDDIFKELGVELR
jgi:hypothetical protein